MDDSRSEIPDEEVRRAATRLAHDVREREREAIAGYAAWVEVLHQVLREGGSPEARGVAAICSARPTRIAGATSAPLFQILTLEGWVGVQDF